MVHRGLLGAVFINIKKSSKTSFFLEVSFINNCFLISTPRYGVIWVDLSQFLKISFFHTFSALESVLDPPGWPPDPPGSMENSKKKSIIVLFVGYVLYIFSMFRHN